MKLVLFTTGAKPWFDLFSRLHDEGVASPVIWVGDPRHEIAARSKFGAEVVQSMDLFVHYTWRIRDVQYGGEFSEFLTSNEYYIAKDRALKMMDRLDVYGCLTRLDREACFRNVCLWGLKRIAETKPDALLTTESPHTHAQFTLYMICRWLGLPRFKLQPSPYIPALVVKQIDGDVVIKPSVDKSEPTYDRMRADLKAYVDRVAGVETGQKYETPYLIKQRQDSTAHGWLRRVFTRKFMHLWGSRIYHRLKFMCRWEYNPLAPSLMQMTISGLTTGAKRRYLNHNYATECQQDPDLGQDYVYFGLHYEPERNTNPDGGAFHDQMLALIELRRLLPDNVAIYVKEHPSQLYSSMRGTLGRSPLFYAQVKNIKGVTLVSQKVQSMDLIRNAVFVSTITGSLANEAAVIGKKAVIFGDAWERNMPNIIRWRAGLTYENIIEQPVRTHEDVLEFLVDLLETEQVAGCHNTSGEERFKTYLSPEFRAVEAKGLHNLVCALSNYIMQDHGA